MGRSIAAIPETANTIFVSEDQTAYNIATLRPYKEAGGTYAKWNESTYSITHFDGGNLLFCDGHVKWKMQSKVCRADFGLAGTQCGVEANGTGATATF